MITRAVEHGVRVFSLTPGNSYYHALSYEEIKELTRVMVEAVDGRGITIAAADAWWTGQAVAYAEYARSVGADAVQVTIPTRVGMQDQADHFRAIAEACGLGVVIHGVASSTLLDALCKIDGVIALKEDTTLTDYIDQQRNFGDRLAIFAGGPKYRYLVAEPYGSPAFYSLYATFAPQIPMRFWQAIQANDRDTAYDIVNTYEFPFFNRWSHQMWRASLEHFGIAQRYLRPPEQSFSAEEMPGVKVFFEGLGLQPEL
jgi:dihydrodipicolinate synthase/N-acetylneuraminate lyase